MAKIDYDMTVKIIEVSGDMFLGVRLAHVAPDSYLFGEIPCPWVVGKMSPDTPIQYDEDNDCQSLEDWSRASYFEFGFEALDKYLGMVEEA